MVEHLENWMPPIGSHLDLTFLEVVDFQSACQGNKLKNKISCILCVSVLHLNIDNYIVLFFTSILVSVAPPAR
jgi:hypothetical protein